MIPTYTARHGGVITHHSPAAVERLVHDAFNNFDELELDAYVASGDCFEMLASNLDQISRLLPDGDEAQPELEHTIRLLLALQRRYKVVRKFQNDKRSRF